MIDLRDYEIKVLRHINGDQVGFLDWGAAMSEAIGFLRGQGFVEKTVKLDGSIRVLVTEKGKEYLAKLEKRP